MYSYDRPREALQGRGSDVFPPTYLRGAGRARGLYADADSRREVSQSVRNLPDRLHMQGSAASALSTCSGSWRALPWCWARL